MTLILVVEDNAMNRKLMRDILEIRFEVVEATRGEEVFALLERRRPDLILMDVQLPGIDGLALVRRLKADQATRDIPVVAVSAHAMQHNIDEARAAGCIDYVTKPLVEDPFVFVDRLGKLVAGGTAAGPGAAPPPPRCH
jgi:CheY-like chemotaxis protein